MSIENKKKYLVYAIILLSVVVIGLSGTYAYFVASVGGTGNTTNNQTSVTAVDLGSIYYEGETVFTGTDIYPGMVAVQQFKIGPQGDSGTGTYEIVLENNLPEEFVGDVVIMLFKTTDPENNYIERIGGEVIQNKENNINTFVVGDYFDMIGEPQIAVSEYLTTKENMILEQVDFDVTTLGETTYFLMYWYMSQGVQNYQQGLNFTGTIKVNLINNSNEVVETDEYKSCVTIYGADSPQCKILAEYEGNAKCPTVDSLGYISVKNMMMGGEMTESYMCSAPDDYGTSYYYVGTTENNWVKFGGYYWRIIRVNGDNSIRMIYAGDASVIDALDETTKGQVLKNGDYDNSEDYTQIGTSRYNHYWKKDNVQEQTNTSMNGDNAGVGYMYGNRDGVTEESTQYNETSWAPNATYYISKEYSYDATTDKFTLKDPIALSGKEMNSNYIGYYTYNIASSTTSYNFIYKVSNVSVENNVTKVGYSYVRYGTTSKEKAQTNTNDSDIKAYVDNWYATNLISYQSYISDTLFCNDRSASKTLPDTRYSNLSHGVELTAYRNYYSGISTLKCEQQNDRFTVADEVVGNGYLTYPVGLITADEAYIAGGSSDNEAYYLRSGSYWTMTPHGYNASYGLVKDVWGSVGSSTLAFQGGVRPVINLKPGVLTKGSGLASDPWMVD